MNPRGRFTSVSVTGQSLSVFSLTVRKDVVIGNVKS